MSKLATLILITVLAVSSLLVVGSVFAQSTPKPSVPKFTARFVNASYTVITTNSYTGLDETELVSNDTIEITIDNQSFDYSHYQIYYNIRVKPHFEDDWIEVFPVRTRTSSYDNGGFSYAEYISDDAIPQSKSSYTVITFSVVPTELYLASGYDIKRHYSGADGQEGAYFAFLSAIPDSGKIDFQVEALAGHEAEVYVNDHPLAPWPIGHYELSIAFDISSGWSETQTITIGQSQTSSPEPTTPTSPTPLPYEETQSTEPEVILGVAVTVAIIVAGLGLLLYLIKRK